MALRARLRMTCSIWISWARTHSAPSPTWVSRTTPARWASGRSRASTVSNMAATRAGRVCGRLLAHEVADVADDLPGPLGLDGDTLHHVAAMLGGRPPALHQMDAGPGIGADGGERLIQLMGDPRGHLPEGAQARHMGQFPLVAADILRRLLALGHVAEHHHAPKGVPALVADGGGAVFHRKAGAVLAPEDVVIHIARDAVAEGGIDRALLGRVRGAVGVGVVQQLVLMLPDEFVGPPAGETLHGGVDEGGAAVQIDPVDPLGHRVQDQFVALLQTCLGALEVPVQAQDP